MKKQFVIAAVLSVWANATFAQDGNDSLRMVAMEGIEVTSTRADARTPMAFTTLDRQEIERGNFGQDMPFILQSTPSVVATSEAGAGIGYTGIRIRGTDATRINVTTNGIPMNDAESHGMFWVNTPDFASSADDIQIQRGVGTSTNGAGAFGGSINIRTESLTSTPFAELSGTYGSYNTHKEVFRFGTGLLGGRWAFSGRLSNVHSDGYIDRASTDLKSFFAQGAYYGRSTVVKLIVFGGRETTYHAWNGIDADQLAADRRYNPSGEIEQVVRDEDGNPVYKDNGKVRTEVVGFYKDQTDNYKQYNYQLLVTQRITNRLDLNVGLHYTRGEGYYEEYKNARLLDEYGLTPFIPADPAKEAYAKKYTDDQGNEYWLVTKSNLVRRKMMDNDFGGGVFSLDYTAPRLTVSLGGAFNRYVGDHFGRVMWVQNYAADPGFSPEHEYYRNVGSKNDGNLYLKANWEAARGLYIYGDMQYRHIRYDIDGLNDRWDYNVGQMQALDVSRKFDFFNPKAGLLYAVRPDMTVYGSIAVAHKEPTRNNFTDAKTDRIPGAERLVDYELGYSYQGPIFNAGVNMYYMDYKDQLILTGELNHIGEALADNVPDSYRMGVELTAGVQITKWLRWDINATLSRNIIKGYTEYLDDYDEDWNELYTQTANYIGNTTISFSPSVLAGSLISARYKGWELALQSNFVGKQYLTNSERDDLSLDPYFVNNLRVGYTFQAKGIRRITVGVNVNNIFNEKYASNGWGSSGYIYEGDGSSRKIVARSDYAGYFPQAGINVLGNVTIRF